LFAFSSGLETGSDKNRIMSVFLSKNPQDIGQAIYEENERKTPRETSRKRL